MTHPILKEIEKNVDIVEYTAKDRAVSYTILFFVLLNLAGVIITLIWGL